MKTETKHYFFKSVKQGSKLRVIPVEGQKAFFGDVDDKKYCSCSKSVREKYPIGTVFFSDSIKVSSTGKYYCAGRNFQAMDSLTGEDIINEYKSLSLKTSSKSDGKDEEVVEKEVVPPTPLTLREEIEADSSLLAPSSTKDGFYVSKKHWSLLVRNIKNHINTMIVGPTGTGKTSVVKEICQRMGLKLHVFDMGSIIDPISSLLGVHRLKDGKSIFDYAEFTQAIQEPGVILLDELSRASLSSNNVLFPCLDDRRKLSIEIAGSDGPRHIDVHPEVTFIATANVGSEYTGTNNMDRALVNRFFPLELGYIPAVEEEKVLCTRTSISKETAKILVKIANNIRDIYNKQEISVSLSIRETLMAANLIKDGWNLTESLEAIFIPLYEGTKSEGERSIIYKTIASY